jgi:hypothetical protein
MAVIFVASFTVAALLHRDTALALLLCGVAMTTLVAAVIGANIRSPRRRPDSLARQGHQQPQLRSAPAEHPPAS